MDFFKNVFSRNLGYKELMDFDFKDDPASRSYLKRVALETTINFIARTFSQSEFWVRDGKELKQNTLSYKLNVRPNTDSSATDFWHKFIYKLVYDNEVLVIQSDTEDLIVADDFYREEKALYPDVFKSVVVKDYQYKRNFYMDEVIYVNYNNEKLQRFLNGLFGDYGELFGRLMDTELRKNQIRALLRVGNGGGNLNKDKTNRLQKFGERILDRFQNNRVAIIPELDGFQYEELSGPGSGSSSGNSTSTKLNDVKKLFIDDVAKIIGIPPSLIHGEMADLSNSMDAYLKFCINPLIEKIEDELNSKFFSESDYRKGKRIEIVGINKRDPVLHSEAIDKLISSGSMTRNEVREMFGLKPVDGLDKFVLTKNYEQHESSKGGETDEKETE